jgi:hypothetical protein
MNDLEPISQPLPAKPAGRGKAVAIGFCAESALWGASWLTLNTNWLAGAGIVLLLLAGAVAPFVALVLLIDRGTRPIALGILLAAGVGLLILGALCSGAYR